MLIPGYDFSRRRFVTLAGTGLFLSNLPCAFGASDFWNKKDPANWTGDDIRVLATRSPWAKDVAVLSRGEGREPFAGSSPTGSGLPGDPGSTSPAQQANARMNIPIGGTGAADARGDERRGPMAAPAVTVRWESAQPIRDALKGAIPADFDQHYVIGVTGFQVPAFDSAGMLERLKDSASLQAKGKDRVQAGVARYSSDKATILFGFSKELLPLTIADKDVQFTINTGDLSLRAKFDPKEMIYRGQLAL
jgi:hypothetical protein